MKLLLKAIIVLFLNVLLFSCTEQKLDQTTKIESFSKVWGFLKYYHPEIAKGKKDWDQEYLSKIEVIKQIQTKDELNEFYSKWIKGLGEVPECITCNDEIPDSLKVNLNLDWISNSSLFNNEVKKQLDYIKTNRNQGDNYYVSAAPEIGNTLFPNEKRYAESTYPSENMRLLALARYWNIIDYFFPYKYKTDDNWEDVLPAQIPNFIEAKDSVEYHLAVLKMVAKINDSHGYVIFDNYIVNEFWGDNYVPFLFHTYEDKVVVTDFFDEKLCKNNDIQRGDIITAVNQQSMEDRINYIAEYYGGSNKNAVMRDMLPSIFNGKSDSLDITFERNGKQLNKKIRRYPLDSIAFNMPYDTSTVKILNDGIVYFNMDLLKEKEALNILEKHKNAKAMIFDVRNHSDGFAMYEVAKFLNDKKKEFSQFSKPNLKYPGTYTFYTDSSGYCGEENEDYYKGKVILLCNAYTQSHAEYTLMALQTAPNVTLIGSQTAGADGNVSEIPLPGGITTLISGIGVFYPDGRETQRIGIVPDIEVYPTPEGLKANKDEILDKALETINQI
ncbi:S41 family peptidase [Flammeovirga sp. OC4]|uniref:S41 family peptidase n=1 Tax=Flammeovirga sp. OC4 TaxID=1382345 RepID=UPI000693743F|nr:S41 family peptidase [Flammeovirga sp. OC4]